MLTNSDQHTHQIMEFMRLYIFHRALTLGWKKIFANCANYAKMTKTKKYVRCRFLQIQTEHSWKIVSYYIVEK